MWARSDGVGGNGVQDGPRYPGRPRQTDTGGVCAEVGLKVVQAAPRLPRCLRLRYSTGGDDG